MRALGPFPTRRPRWLPCRRAVVKSLFGGALLALCVVPLGPSVAQSPGRLQGSAEPGRDVPTLMPLDESEPALLDFDVSIELPGGADVPAGMGETQVFFSDLAIEGNKAFSDEDLADLFAEQKGQDISVKELFGFAQAIESRYRQDGYFAAFVYYPPQTSEDGRYTLTVIEGYIAEILLEIKDQRLAEALRGYFEPLTERRPIRMPDLERALLLADDLDGLAVSAFLRPHKGEQGASELVIKATHDPLTASLSVDNRGSKYAGPLRGKASLNVQSMIDAGDRLGISVGSTRKQGEKRDYGFDLEFPIGYDGLRFIGTFDRTRGRPGWDLAQYELKAKSDTLSLLLTYPLIRSRAFTLDLTGGLDVRNNDALIFNQRYSRDRLREAFVDALITEQGFLGGSTQFGVSVYQGLPWLGATHPDEGDMSRADALPTGTRLTFDFTRIQPLWGQASLALGAEGQYSFHPLASALEYGVGGTRFGRGYDSGEILGDKGVAGSVELHYRFDFTDVPMLKGIEPYGFYDFGMTWDQKSPASEGGRHTLASGGFGIDFDFDYGISAEFLYAQPLTRAPYREPDDALESRFFFTLSFEY